MLFSRVEGNVMFIAGLSSPETTYLPFNSTAGSKENMDISLKLSLNYIHNTHVSVLWDSPRCVKTEFLLITWTWVAFIGRERNVMYSWNENVKRERTQWWLLCLYHTRKWYKPAWVWLWGSRVKPYLWPLHLKRCLRWFDRWSRCLHRPHIHPPPSRNALLHHSQTANGALQANRIRIHLICFKSTLLK